MNETWINLVRLEAKHAAEAESTEEGRVKAAMKAAKNHWMVTDKDSQFKGACSALFDLGDEEMHERIIAEMNALRDLSALLSGVPIDIERITKLEKPLGLMKAFSEA